MADHRSHTRSGPLRLTAVLVPRLLLCGLALLASPRAPALDAGARAQAQAIGVAAGRTVLDERLSAFLERSGQISPQQYQARLQGDQVELGRLQQMLVRMPADQRNVVRLQATNTFNHGMVQLNRQIAEWQRRGAPRGSRGDSAPASQPYIPPPPPYVPPAPPRQSSGFERLLVLLLVGAGVGAGVVVIARRRRTSSPALPADVEAIPPRSFAPSLASTSAPALPAEPESLPAVPASGSVMPKPTATVSAAPVAGDAKARLLGEQAAKYQAALTAAMDELMATQAALEERKAVGELLRKDIARVGTLVYDRVKKLLHEATPGSAKAVTSALMLMPVWRRFRRGGLGLKIVIGIGVWWLVSRELRLLSAGLLFVPVVLYLIVAGVCFYFERRAQTRGTVKELEASAAQRRFFRIINSRK